MKLVALVFVVVAGCSSNKSSVVTPPPSNTGGSAASDTCTSDDDCVLIETECCDHCNGGKRKAVTKSRAAVFQRPTNCGGCTKKGCAPDNGVGMGAACREERCTSVIDM
jgi:hypothetical protein